MIFSPGDIINLNFTPAAGHEPLGFRPALVVSRLRFNTGTSMTIVCPITTTDNGFPLHFPLPDGLETTGFVALEQIRAVDTSARQATLIESVGANSSFMDDVRQCVHSFV